MTTIAPACPWCGQLRVRGVTGSTDGNQWYRCSACRTAFFIHVPPRRLATLALEPLKPAVDGPAPQVMSDRTTWTAAPYQAWRRRYSRRRV